MARIAQCLIVVIALSVLLFAGRHDQRALEILVRDSSVADVITVRPRNIPVILDYIGQTELTQRVAISARVSGLSKKCIYRAGEGERADSAMLLVDQTRYEVALETANEHYVHAGMRLDFAHARVDRLRNLAMKNTLSLRVFDEAIEEERAAAAAVKIAREKVEAARRNLGFTTAISPVSALASRVRKAPVASSNPDGALLSYAIKLDPLWINFSVSADDLMNLRAQMQGSALLLPGAGKLDAVVVLADGSIYPQRGQVTFTDTERNPKVRSYLIRAEIPNPAGSLRPSQFVRVKLLGATRANAIAVPQNALREGPRGAYVWIVDSNSRARKRPVEPGEWTGSAWLIRSGLKDGDRVIVGSIVTLIDGARVKANSVPIPPATANLANGAPANIG